MIRLVLLSPPGRRSSSTCSWHGAIGDRTDRAESDGAARSLARATVGAGRSNTISVGEKTSRDGEDG